MNYREPRTERQAYEQMRDAADEAERFAMWALKNTPAKSPEVLVSDSQVAGMDSLLGSLRS